MCFFLGKIQLITTVANQVGGGVATCGLASVQCSATGSSSTGAVGPKSQKLRHAYGFGAFAIVAATVFLAAFIH